MNIEEAKAVLKLKSIEFSKNIEHEAFDNIEKADFSLEKEAIETVLAELEKKENMTICGKTPEEAYKILSGIELEKQYEKKVSEGNE